MSLTMPTALLHWDPDRQPGSWSSDDPPRGSVLQARDQQNKMSHSPSQPKTLWTVVLFLPWTKNTGELQVACPVWYSAYFLKCRAFFDRIMHITVWRNW